MSKRFATAWLGLGRRLSAMEAARRARLRRPVTLDDKIPFAPRKERVR
ncbi:hypothetical protein ROJ8625_02686 [Roseivivax jejudonensis]|uniref:Uncharacterized protein n=1 Tax=Roseivivax jejudonensis TaxID=1529041 RepID=A0A1X6ZJ21_9RHOB|nr:hypothetical protein [Roseivivax jejudonensis]SLN52877.1 hypothetical protein ROJ8625_02686 [Roseivivax jejudonensis]